MTSKSAESSQPFQLHRSHPTSLAMSRSAAQQIKLSGNSPLEISSTFEVPDAQLSMGLLMNGWKIGPPMDHELWKTCSTKKMGPYEATFFYNPLLWDNKPCFDSDHVTHISSKTSFGWYIQPILVSIQICIIRD